jgi:ParB family chromosome partitioning protein
MDNLDPFAHITNQPEGTGNIPAVQPFSASPAATETPEVLSTPLSGQFVHQPVMGESIQSAIPPATEGKRSENAFVSERVSYADAQIQEIEVALIVPNPFQPRKVFQPEALRELADSIREHGVIQPLVVTKTPVGYEIVVGERRFRASQLAGLLKVPAIVKEGMVDQTKLEVALIENIQRQELNPIEEAQAYERLMKTFNLTQEQVAKKVGKSRPAVANTVRLLNLPAEIQRGIVEGKITEGHGRAMLGLVDPEKMLLMFKMIQEQNMNVRQVEAKVREISMRRQMDAAAPDPKLMALETELRGKLGTQVKIQRQGRGGRITIDFFSDEELDDLVGRMATQQGPSGSDYLTV